MKFLFLTLMFSFFSGVCIAQHIEVDPIKQNSITTNIGFNQFKDENLHPKVFRGLGIGAYYTHTKIENHISEYSAGFGISATNTYYEEFPSALSVLLSANYKHLFSVAESDKIVYYLGPLTDFQYGANAYFNWDESHFYHANYLSQGVGNRLNYRLGKHNFNFTLDFPLVSVISRPVPDRQYKIDDITFFGVIKNLGSNPELSLIDKNFYLKSGLEFFFKSKKMKNRSIGYDFLYHRMMAKNGGLYQNARQTISFKHIF